METVPGLSVRTGRRKDLRRDGIERKLRDFVRRDPRQLGVADGHGLVAHHLRGMNTRMHGVACDVVVERLLRGERTRVEAQGRD